MTNEKAKIIIGNIPIKPEVLDGCYSIPEYQDAKAMAIKALEKSKRYKSVWLEEHDAEPFCYKSILDTKTNEVYVCKGDAEHFKQYGMTIEKREEDEE